MYFDFCKQGGNIKFYEINVINPNETKRILKQIQNDIIIKRKQEKNSI